MPLSCNGNVPSQPTGTAHIRHCRRYVQKSVWCAAHGMYSPFLLTDFHQPSALCAGTETVVLLPGLRIYCSITYFFAAVKGFWREKTLFHDLRHPTDRDPRFFRKNVASLLPFRRFFYIMKKSLPAIFQKIVKTHQPFLSFLYLSGAAAEDTLYSVRIRKERKLEILLSRQSVRRHV